ncbi:hypothetical protein ZOSMA_181G00320 [Zostera marina]|uniref:Dof zinc finger protein n=1 Tax=Zostera marina TaxID=29655 RepID=A0A0K9PT15_ZOSMR|nr:hypothetical protein ZOSMA_181G00320 [Zostera marina]
MVLMPGGNRNRIGYTNHQGLSATTTTTARTADGANSISTVGGALIGTSTQAHQPLKCPRCESSNTKFCYYNNYSLTQPRHLCKACKRYWTRGGTLRNVPVGGGCRKNKRVKRSSSSFITATAANTTTVTAMVSDPNLFPNHVSTLSLPPTYSSCAMDPIFYGNSTGIDFPTTYPSSFLKKLNHTTVNSYNPINSNLTSMGLCFPINAALPTHQDCMTHPPNHLQFQQTDSSNSLFHDFSLLGTSSFTTLRHPKTSINSTGWSANDRNIQAPVASGASDLRNFDGVKEEEEGRSIGVLDWQIQYDGDLFQNLNAVEGNSLYWNVNPLSGISNTWPELPTAATANHSVT